MREIFLFLMLLNVSFACWADTEYNTDDIRQTVSSSKEFADNMRKDYEELEKQILKLDPDFADFLKTGGKFKIELTEYQKIALARSYLAQKAFDYYKDSFTKELEQHSKETGRKIIISDFNNDKTNYKSKQMWLDRGKLDSKECMRDGWRVCKYQDGFENFVVDLYEVSRNDLYDFQAGIFYRKDIYNQNAVQHCSVSLSYQSDGNQTYNTSVFLENLIMRVSCDVMKYDEFYEWQNQEVEDTVNGKHDVVGTELMSDGRVREIERQEEDFSKWKSNNNIPDGLIMSRTYNYSQSISATNEDSK